MQIASFAHEMWLLSFNMDILTIAVSKILGIPNYTEFEE